MKKTLLSIAAIFALSGCTGYFEETEEQQNQEAVSFESTATIQTQDQGFILVWKKNTTLPAQLDITTDINFEQSVVKSSEGKKEIALSCTFDENRNTEKGINDYLCTATNVNKIGEFHISLIAGVELLIVERTGEDSLILGDMVVFYKGSNNKTPPPSTKPSPTPPSGHAVLIEEHIEPAGSHCEFGGTKVDAGSDLNDNNALEESEIEKTSYVCNKNVNSLMTTSDESNNTRCPNGGVRIDSGIDNNNNRKLDENEILNTEYVCK